MKKVNWKKVKEVLTNVGEWFVILAILGILIVGAALQFGLINIGA